MLGGQFAMKDGESEHLPISRRNAGLCADCAQARQITSDRAATFLQCQLSFTDSRFEKYPQLPVRVCNGYERNPNLAAQTDPQVRTDH
jgi:hypothetical protein